MSRRAVAKYTGRSAPRTATRCSKPAGCTSSAPSATSRRRIDNQLRGRAGRQGDPGASRFYLSLEDDLMRIFGGERIQNLMDPPGDRGGRADRAPA